ncbi:polysaccharide deacetylase family protein [Marinobacter sp. R17]|uniref:polysaccharide deacetylase family protein n=1 Tax=Marinobacter sp. R17 TaxID=2484250 RepID=UPI0016804A86|nr:polysaccharide deacetylase family protein [Marinobacter sp. R17]
MGVKNRIFKYYFPQKAVDLKQKRRGNCNGIVLMYHEVLEDSIDIPAWTIVKRSNFEWQMKYLRNNFDVVTMDEATKRVCGLSEGQRPFAVVTFDDGYKGNFNNVLPVMNKLSLPFVVYVATKAVSDSSIYWYDKIIGLLDKRDDLFISIEGDDIPIRKSHSNSKRWSLMQKALSKLKSMSASERDIEVKKILDENDARSFSSRIGMLSASDLGAMSKHQLVTIGNHTHGHELLDQISGLEIYNTINKANCLIESWTGIKPKHFAYPNGNYSENVLDALSAFGFSTLVTTKPGIWDGSRSLMEIPRLGIGRFETKSQFKARLAGFL